MPPILMREHRLQRPVDPVHPGPALVLGGGGAYGIIQAAYILAAYEAGFRPSMVVGTSVGSLNGAHIALFPDEPDRLLRIWLGLDSMKLIQMQPWRVMRQLLRNPRALFANEIVPQIVARHLKGSSFAELKLPLGVVATNLHRGEKHVFQFGLLEPAILASTAIPGVFDPVNIGGELFVDGCVSASVDIATAVAMGATEILAIDLTPMPALAQPKTIFGVMRQSFSILSRSTTEAMEACVARQMPVRVIRPDLSRSSSWRLDDSAGAVAHNLRLAREAIPEVLAGGQVIPAEATCPLPATAPIAEPVVIDRFFRVRRAS
jgi:NTE family protein